MRNVYGSTAESRLVERVDRLSTAELADWADTAALALERLVGQWTRDGDRDGLSDARATTATLLYVLDSLDARVSGPGPGSSGRSFG